MCVDVTPAHLDRPFDYLVTADQHEAAAAGCRVKVRFAGRRVGGWLLERRAESDHAGALTPLAGVVSAEPVVSAELSRLARAVADRWAGTAADVLRLAVPPRHARVEAEARADRERGPLPAAEGPLCAAGARLLWPTPPGADWPAELARAAAATAARGRGAVLVVPDQRDLDAVDAALRALLGEGHHVALSAGLGPAERYRRWLRASRGEVSIAVGTRAAAYAPVPDLALVVCWDDGDDLLAEPRAPYAHARDVLLLRAHLAGAGVVLAGHAVTPEAAQLAERGWLEVAATPRAALREAAPRVQATGGDPVQGGPGRLPHLGFTVLREALAEGPVLVQVPRQGYQHGLRCQRCSAPARCPTCLGALERERADQVPACSICGRVAPQWCCATCGDDRLRSGAAGERRTAEELGRAFPGVPVVTSGGADVRHRVPADRALVVATPGAEPWVEGGYAAALLLDAPSLLGRTSSRAAEEAARRWLGAAALVRARGRVVLAGPAEVPAVQALIRWDPLWLARRELADRTAAHLPPGARLAVVDGPPGEALAVADEVAGALAVVEVLGPVARPWHDDDGERVVLRVPLRDGDPLAAALARSLRSRSSTRRPAVRVQLDPLEIGF